MREHVNIRSFLRTISDSIGKPFNLEKMTADQFNDSDGCVETITLTYDLARKFIPMYGIAESFYTTYVLSVLLVSGILDNAAFIYVVAKQSSMKTATNRYLVNLAISDILFLSSTIGEKLWKFTHSPFVLDDTPIAPAGCILLPFIGDTAYFASLFFITLVSAEIFHAICFPRGKSLFQNRTCSGWLAVLVWVISGITAAVLAPSNSGAIQVCLEWIDPERTGAWPTVITTCGTPLDWLKNLMHIIQIIPFFVTLTLNVFLFYRILTGLNQSIDRMRSHSTKKRGGDTRLRNQIARMLVVNGIVFFVLLTPFELLSLLRLTKVDVSQIQGLFATIARGLMYLNSVVNPIIYMAMSQRYREAFVNAFFPTQRCRGIAVTSSCRSVQASSSFLRPTQSTTKM